jgi:hypothetical protein
MSNRNGKILDLQQGWYILQVHKLLVMFGHTLWQQCSTFKAASLSNLVG